MSVNKPGIKDGILYGADVNLPPHKNYGKLIMDIFKLYKDKIALVDGITGEKITFSEIVQKTMNVADSLRRLGIKKGDVIAICSENRFEFLITCYAIIYIGATANFLNKAYSIDEMVHSIGISKPRYVFCSPETYVTYKKILTQLRFPLVYVYGKSNARNLNSYNILENTKVDVNSVVPAEILDGSQTAIITYSSGTTGLPKGVKWTHHGLMIAASQPISSERDLTYLMIAPWTNTMGYIVTNDLLTKGKTVVFLPKFNETLYLSTIAKYKVNFLIAVPPLIIILTKCQNLKDYDLTSVELIYSGGATLETKLIEEAKKKLPNLKYILQSYGMSEITGGVSQESETENKLGSVGKIFPGLQAKVVDKDTREILGPRKSGEICVKGPALFGGYIGNPRLEDYDSDGYYKTGDVGYYDEEGYFFIVDRVKEIIKYKGYQVGPTELETVILQHPGVKDAGVVGVPDEVAGELPLAFVVKQPDVVITEQDIKEFVASKVSNWKQLRGGVKFVEEIPKNPTGKILRRILKDMIKKPTSKL